MTKKQIELVWLNVLFVAVVAALLWAVLGGLHA